MTYEDCKKMYCVRRQSINVTRMAQRIQTYEKEEKKIITSACACVVRECVRVSDREETEEVVSTKRKLKEGDERERGKKEEKKRKLK